MATERQAVSDALEVATLEDPIYYCRVSLAKSWPRPIDLSWKRDNRTRAQKIVLRPGKSVVLELGKAQAYFGMFTIPGMIETVNDIRKRERLAEQFKESRERAILLWGDSPKPARYGSGMTYEALGPARIPDVTCTVMNADEEADASAPIRIRELYNVGEYVDAEHLVNPGGFAAHKHAEELKASNDFEKASNAEQINVLQGQVATLTQLLLAKLSPDEVAAMNTQTQSKKDRAAAAAGSKE